VPSLPDIVQRFVADVSRYVGPLQEAAAAAAEFATANEGTKEALDGVRDKAVEAGEGMKEIRDAAAEDDVALDGVRNRAEETASAFGRLRDKAASAAASMMANAGAMDVVSGATAGAHGIPPMILMWGSLAAAIAAVLPGVLAFAGGIAAFGLFALPIIKTVVTGLTATNQQLKAMPKAQQEIIKKSQDMMAGLKNEFNAISKMFAPTVWKLFGEALHVAAELLPRIVPLAQQGAIAFEHIIGDIGRGIQSQKFAEFLSALTKLVVPATDAIMHLLGSFMNLIDGVVQFLPHISVPFINFLTQLVNALSGPLIAGLSSLARLLMDVFQILSPLLTPLSKFIIMIAKDLGSGFDSILTPLKKVSQELGKNLGPLLTGLEPVISNFLTPNSPLVLALDAVVPLIGYFADALGSIGNYLTSHPEFAKLAVWIMSAVAALRIATGVMAAFSAAMDANPVGIAIIAIAALVAGVIELYKHWKPFRDFMNDWGHQMVDSWRWAAKEWDRIAKWFEKYLNDFRGWWKRNGAEVMAIIHVSWTNIVNFMTVVGKALFTVIKVAWDLIVMVIKVAWDLIKGITVTVWDVIKDIVMTTVHVIRDAIDVSLQLIQGHWGAAWNDIKNMTGALVGGIGRLIYDIFHGLVSTLYNVGRDIISGLISGIESMFNGLVSTAQSMASTVTQAFTGLLHIFSPSKVFYQHGVNIAQGLIMGMDASRAAVGAAGARLGRAVLPGGLGGGGAGFYGPAMLGAGGGGRAVTVNVTVNGSVVTEQQLEQVIQQQILRYSIRNSGNGLTLPGRR